MKKSLFYILISIVIIGCDKEIIITPPTILIPQTSYSVGSEITIRVEEYAEIDGERVYADYFYWFIEDKDQNIIASDFPDSASIVWIPEEAGYCVIKVRIGYDDNKSITAIKEIEVFEQMASLQNKLAGDWSGTAYRSTDLYWTVKISFDSTGHCWGQVTSPIPWNFPCLSIFFSGATRFYGEDGYLDSCNGNSNYPCQRLTITDVDNNVGKGQILIGHGHVHAPDTSAYWDCTDCGYLLGSLYFVNDPDSLYFRLDEGYSGYYYLEYYLSRMK